MREALRLAVENRFGDVRAVMATEGWQTAGQRIEMPVPEVPDAGSAVVFVRSLSPGRPAQLTVCAAGTSSAGPLDERLTWVIPSEAPPEAYADPLLSRPVRWGRVRSCSGLQWRKVAPGAWVEQYTAAGETERWRAGEDAWWAECPHCGRLRVTRRGGLAAVLGCLVCARQWKMHQRVLDHYEETWRAPSGRPDDALRRARIVELARSGRWTQHEIAKVVGVTPSCVCKTLKKAGVAIRDGRRRRSAA